MLGRPTRPWRYRLKGCVALNEHVVRCEPFGLRPSGHARYSCRAAAIGRVQRSWCRPNAADRRDRRHRPHAVRQVQQCDNYSSATSTELTGWKGS